MDRNGSFYIDTLGCKLNQAESEEMARSFLEAGARAASSIEDADLYILNTCAVTQEAERKARQSLRRARNLNPEAKIFAAGCYARHSPGVIENMDGVRPLHNDQLRKLILEDLTRPGNLPRGLLHGNLPRTRSMLKIQEGCNYRCTYCVVPSVKGREHSIPPGQIIDAVKSRVKEGYKEVVLTGTRVGAYSHEGHSLRELISRILRETSIERIRLSSLQPQEISEDLLALWSDKRLCPHFHIPLQSGSDEILRKMGRHYNISNYVRCIENLRQQIPEAGITTDIIVGFPGERDSEFREGLELCRELGFSKIHVFPYSPRVGTPAAGREGHLDINTKKARSAQMLELSRLSQLSYLEGNTGTACNVLWETDNDGLWSGLSESYIKVYCHSKDNLRNSISSVRIQGLFRDGLAGDIV